MKKIIGVIGGSAVDWGAASKNAMNEFITAKALYVLGIR